MAGKKLTLLQLQKRNALCVNQLLTPRAAVGGRREQHVLLPEVNVEERTDAEWLNAKEYSELPGPSRLNIFMHFLPGGKLYNTNIVDLGKFLRLRYGDILVTKGIMGKPDIVFTYNPDDYATTYRNEGNWPIRLGLDSFTYYRKEKRPDVFQGIGGLVSEQGKSWADIRYKVNPILMKVKNIRENLPEIDNIASEFMHRFEQLRDPNTGKLRANFQNEIKMWSMESVAFIALDTRLGLLSATKNDTNAHKLAQHMTDFFDMSYQYDVLPSLWKYIELPGFKRFLGTYDNITDITTNYINAAISKFEQEQNVEAKSVLEKLCRLDKTIAIVMAMDMLMAGLDTTSSAFISTLYHIAANAEKQEALRQELHTIMPTPDTPLSADNTKNMPYLRACIKEALRIVPITPANVRIATQDLVLSGYKIPRGTGINMNIMMLSNEDKYFARSAEFLPERWLKSGANACPMAQKTHPFVYLPFGFGPRTCIGKRIAEMEMETLLAKLIRNYRVTWQSAEPLKYASSIILVPHGELPFKFEKI